MLRVDLSNNSLIPEWNRSALEALREPLESGHIRIARAARSVQYPARFQLVAAMNPCPCTYDMKLLLATPNVTQCRDIGGLSKRHSDHLVGNLV